MASPVINPPKTLPADFNGWDSGPPKTLPSDFSGWDAAPASSSPPDSGSFFGGVGNRLKGLAEGLYDLAKPPSTGTEKALSLISGPVGPAFLRAARGMGSNIAEAGSQAGKQLSEAQATKDPINKPLAYARAGTTFLSAFNPLATGSVTDINKLENEGRSREAAGAGLTDAALLSLPFLKKGATAAAQKVLPSAQRAGASLQDIKSTVGSMPINTAAPGNSALELYSQSQRGAVLPKAVRQLVNRLSDPNAPPLTYAEAKDFQSNISRLSANERMNLNPNTARLVGQLNADLKSSLQQAADTAGKGAQFQQAMREYHNAMKLKGYSDAAIAHAWKWALAGAGLYGAKKILGINLPGEVGH